MIKKTKIQNCEIISYRKSIDIRGYFLRLFDYKKINIKQISISHNKYKNTFRGFHYQTGKFSENKFVFCVKGSLIDYVIDIRKNSHSYLKVLTIKLTDTDNKILFIPKGCLHGFITLKNNTDILYLIDKKHNKKFSKGFNYKSKNFKLKIMPKIISKKDKLLPYFYK